MKYPKEKELSRLMDLIKGRVFPEYSETENADPDTLEEAFGNMLDAGTASALMEAVPEIGRLLRSDVEAMLLNDPAVMDVAEVILCYPAIKVMLHYRVAHELHRLGVKVIPRMLTEMAHSATGIDIHPAARIGERFAIDHGTGVVIGETAVIGDGVTLYQGVTLGARNFRYDDSGRPVNVPRHPVIEDNVTIYSNASVLGRVTIGHDSIIGGNVWLTRDVPPYSKVIHGKTITLEVFSEGAGI